jgi:hypothetical protein
MQTAPDRNYADAAEALIMTDLQDDWSRSLADPVSLKGSDIAAGRGGFACSKRQDVASGL